MTSNTTNDECTKMQSSTEIKRYILSNSNVTCNMYNWTDSNSISNNSNTSNYNYQSQLQPKWETINNATQGFVSYYGARLINDTNSITNDTVVYLFGHQTENSTGLGTVWKYSFQNSNLSTI